MTCRPDGMKPIQFGICAPAVCSVEILEKEFYIIKEMIWKEFHMDVSVLIPEKTCQFEEKDTNLKTIDKYAM